MHRKYSASLKLSLQQLDDKNVKVVANMIRFCISNEHGFLGNKGVTDERLRQCSIVIRFATSDNRKRFWSTMKGGLSPKLVERIFLKALRPRPGVQKPCSWVSYN